MKCLKSQPKAKEWIAEGLDRGASHLIVLYNTLESEYTPAFVFPEQDIEFEVVRLIENSNGNMMIGVICLYGHIDEQVETVLRPPHMVVSRIEN